MAIKPLSERVVQTILENNARFGVPYAECEDCGEPRPPKARYCSDRCKQRAARKRRNGRQERRVQCVHCEATFITTNPRAVACPAEIRTPECEQAREDAENAKDFNYEDECQAPDCENEVQGAMTGRKRNFCSRACQQRAYRHRREVGH